MRYEEFLEAWREVFERSGGRFPAFGRPTETISIQSMTRQYAIRLADTDPLVEPFTVSAKLAWSWDPLKFARTATTEEDVLNELLGRVDLDDRQTERPWLRVDISLAANAHLDAKLQLPDAAAWRRWSREVSSLLEAVLPSAQQHEDEPLAGTSWRGDPSVELRCGEGGQLYLTGVLMDAWSAVDLPRIWDDLERPQDVDPREALRVLARRVQAALGIWSDALRTLQRAAEVH